MNKLFRNRQEKGITLIALVITIIILLILAVVAITAVNGDGIIGKAKEAGSSYNEKAGEEDAELKRQIGLIEGAINPEGEMSTEETDIPIGEIIEETPNNKAARVGDLVYIIDSETDKTAKVCANRGDIDYTTAINYYAITITNPNIVIASKVNIGGETYLVTSISENAFASWLEGNANSITSINIPDSITSIENGAFKIMTDGSTNVSNITIPSSVTNMGNSVFSGWTSGQNINVFWDRDNKPSGWSDYWTAITVMMETCDAAIHYADDV